MNGSDNIEEKPNSIIPSTSPTNPDPYLSSIDNSATNSIREGSYPSKTTVTMSTLLIAASVLGTLFGMIDALTCGAFMCSLLPILIAIIIGSFTTLVGLIVFNIQNHRYKKQAGISSGVRELLAAIIVLPAAMLVTIIPMNMCGTVYGSFVFPWLASFVTGYILLTCAMLFSRRQTVPLSTVVAHSAASFACVTCIAAFFSKSSLCSSASSGLVWFGIVYLPVVMLSIFFLLRHRTVANSRLLKIAIGAVSFIAAIIVVLSMSQIK